MNGTTRLAEFDPGKVEVSVDTRGPRTKLLKAQLPSGSSMEVLIQVDDLGTLLGLQSSSKGPWTPDEADVLSFVLARAAAIARKFEDEVRGITALRSKNREERGDCPSRRRSTASHRGTVSRKKLGPIQEEVVAALVEHGPWHEDERRCRWSVGKRSDTKKVLERLVELGVVRKVSLAQDQGTSWKLARKKEEDS